MHYSDTFLKSILSDVRVIAVVGFSANPARPSNGVARYLREQGYTVIPVNPGLAGQLFEGQEIYASLGDIPVDVDMVDVFRVSEAVPDIVQEAIARWTGLKAIWLQLGVVNDAGLAPAEAIGIRCVQDRCPKIEIPRLGLSKA